MTKQSLWIMLLSPPVITAMLKPETLRLPLVPYFEELIEIWVLTILVSVPLWMAYTFILPRVLPRLRPVGVRLVGHAVSVIGSVVLGICAYWFLKGYMEGVPCNFAPRDFLPSAYCGTIIASIFVFCETTYMRLRRQAREVELRAQRARQAAVEAQLQTLQARTNPHFLFNSLNTVAGLIQEDPDRAERMVERLADLFRYALDGSRKRTVRLAQEISIVQDYLAVESIRLGSRLRYQIDVDPVAGTVELPPLLLQPIVENAVQHGVSQHRSGGSVTVKVCRVDAWISITVADDGPGLGGSYHAGTGTSMDELRKRLQLSYGDAAYLTPRMPNSGGHEVELLIPHEVPQR